MAQADQPYQILAYGWSGSEGVLSVAVCVVSGEGLPVGECQGQEGTSCPGHGLSNWTDRHRSPDRQTDRQAGGRSTYAWCSALICRGSSETVGGCLVPLWVQLGTSQMISCLSAGSSSGERPVRHMSRVASSAPAAAAVVGWGRVTAGAGADCYGHMQVGGRRI
jgi:hypothetical protein